MLKKLRRRRNPFHRLQWRLTFSYTLVTVAALVVVELLLVGLLLLLFGSDFIAQVIARAAVNEIAPEAAIYLQESPVDLAGLNSWLEELGGGQPQGERGATRITRGLSIEFDENQWYFVLDADENLLAQFPSATEPVALGQPFDTRRLPGVESLLPAALAGELDSDHLYATMPGGTLIVAAPIPGQENKVSGVFIMSLLLPRLNLETLQPLVVAILYSVIPFTLAAGLIGAIFGYLTARGLSRRLAALAHAAGAWSQGDFSTIAADRSADELGQLARRLNAMAEHLQNLMQARQELAALEERNRLARDLHDSVKQQLFAAAMQVGAASASLDSDIETAREHLANAAQLTTQCRQELSGLIQELRPAALESAGLVSALEAYATDWSRQSGIEAQVRAVGERPLPLSTEQMLFRVVQEALSNVARHSEARSVVIQLIWEEAAMALSVEDDGIGFDPQGSEGRGFGLRSMRDRIEALGGSFQIESKAGKGARISIRLKSEAEEVTEDEPN